MEKDIHTNGNQKSRNGHTKTGQILNQKLLQKDKEIHLRIFCLFVYKRSIGQKDISGINIFFHQTSEKILI